MGQTLELGAFKKLLVDVSRIYSGDLLRPGEGASELPAKRFA